MKKLFFLNFSFKFFLIFSILFFTTFTIRAEEKKKAINDVLTEIRSELKLGPNDYIDPNKVPDKLLEELGDAVMDQMVPYEQQHEWMDQMMGGEGSLSLEAMHRAMGYRYLTGNGYGDSHDYHGYGYEHGYGHGMMNGQNRYNMMGR